MRVLLDECLPVDFRNHLRGHEVHSVEWAGFKSLKNGQLLQQAESAGYEVFLTVDQGAPHQQDLIKRKISILVICPPTNRIEDLLPFVGEILSVLREIQPGQVRFAL